VGRWDALRPIHARRCARERRGTCDAATNRIGFTRHKDSKFGAVPEVGLGHPALPFVVSRMNWASHATWCRSRKIARSIFILINFPLAAHIRDNSTMRDRTAHRHLRAKKGGRVSTAPPDQLPPVTSRFQRAWWRSYKVMVPLWIVMIGLTWLALEKNVDKSIIAGVLVVVGLISNAFAWLLGIVALVPIIGPLIVKILSIGFIWLLNGVGYLVSYVAIRRGYSKDVLTYRGLTVSVIIGIVIGFVLGRLL
jgi:hypothetical protein